MRIILIGKLPNLSRSLRRAALHSTSSLAHRDVQPAVGVQAHRRAPADGSIQQQQPAGVGRSQQGRCQQRCLGRWIDQQKQQVVTGCSQGHVRDANPCLGIALSHRLTQWRQRLQVHLLSRHKLKKARH